MINKVHYLGLYAKFDVQRQVYLSRKSMCHQAENPLSSLIKE
jgi:hypothetical protein